jgi:hypothetical protein
MRSCILGTLNVVDPSPTPNVVPITANSSEKVVRLIAAPSQIVQPVGAELVVHMITAPTGAVVCPAVVIAFSMSVSDLAVTFWAIWSFATIVLAAELSCARTIVSVSTDFAVTRITSAFVVVGCTPVGHTTALNGAAGNFAPSPGATIRVVPDAAGDGAVATTLYAKFFLASNTKAISS